MTTAIKEYRDFEREIVQRRWDQRKRRREILQRIAGCSTALFVNRSGLQIVVHRCTRADRDNDWQVTTFAADGMPWGHHCAPTFAEGCLRAGGASQDSYWNEYGYELQEVR